MTDTDHDHNDTHTQREIVRTLTAIVSALCLLVLVPLNAWALNRLVDLSERQGRLEERFNSFAGPGPRYTQTDAEKDFGILTTILERQGKIIDDHEGRIRTIERK